MKPRPFLDALDHDRIVAAIRDAEAQSSGEIRVHVSWSRVSDAKAAGARQFERLGMTRTERRNGVLLYLAPRSQKFAVLGDRGIHEKCGEDFWQRVSDALAADFRAGRFTDGIVAGVTAAGAELAKHFPPPETNDNELPDTVTEDRAEGA